MQNRNCQSAPSPGGGIPLPRAQPARESPACFLKVETYGVRQPRAREHTSPRSSSPSPAPYMGRALGALRLCPTRSGEPIFPIWKRSRPSPIGKQEVLKSNFQYEPFVQKLRCEFPDSEQTSAFLVEKRWPPVAAGGRIPHLWNRARSSGLHSRRGIRPTVLSDGYLAIAGDIQALF